MLTLIFGVDATFTYVLLSKSVNKPSSTGLIKLDVADFLKNKVEYRDNFLYNVINQADKAAGGPYNFRHYPIYDGGPELSSGPVSLPSLYYFVNSTKQIQQRYGQNMAEYVPFMELKEDEIKAKFLSDFKTPSYFEGYPFSLGFIYSDLIMKYKIQKAEVLIGADGDTIIRHNYALLTTQSQYVNRLTLRENPYTIFAKKLNVWLEADSDITHLPTEDYAIEGYSVADYVLHVADGSIPSDPIYDHSKEIAIIR